MKKFLAMIIVAVSLQGCLYNHRSVPRELDMLPNDCVNQANYERFLTGQINDRQGWLMTDKAYELQQRQIKRKLWGMRYNCNR